MELIRIVNLYFHGEYSSTFVDKFEEYKPKLLEHEGCLGVKLYNECNAVGDFVTISTWSNQKYLDIYRESQLFRTMWSSIKPYFRKEAKAISTIEINK
ncbi:antibiotic biosynthesis monooxygenase [Membranihabitans maritimus]|uniref:antibiotic biosynthesis monooxygenase n=1 Tax=Membranihabitans maritimus TaxID=2904244 RepID=UPI001F479CDA|nr:antibiotic biosynthesis monooxygenase [Membranihabitans maritimus]